MRTTDATTLTVLTWNIHHGVGTDRRLDLERVAAVIASSGAHVVALQEIDEHWGRRSGNANQPRRLAGMLGMRAVFGAARECPASPGEPPPRSGNALLTSLPIIESGVHELPPATDPSRPWPEPRVLIRARLYVGGTAVLVGVTHLDPGSRRSRRAAARAIGERLAREPGPVVLMGDMNAAARAPELATWRARGLSAARSDPSTPGAPAGRAPRRLRTFPAGLPVLELDAVHVRGLTVESAEVMDERRASDHRPLRARLLLPGEHAGSAGEHPA